MTLALLLLLPAFASDPLLESWRTRTGLPLEVPEAVRLQPAEGGIALVGPGVSLLLAPAGGDTPLQAALDAQLAPFLMAGSPAPTPQEGACTLGGQAARCLEATVEVVPGARLHLRAAHRPSTDWVAVCLRRSSASAELCEAVVKASASSGPGADSEAPPAAH